MNVAFYALVRKEDFAEKWESHGMQWVPIGVPDLAFDHNDVVTYARERLKRRVSAVLASTSSFRIHVGPAQPLRTSPRKDV